ncbi:Hypothetical protein P9303_22451 [Prochlorococcus marinus str. MIT 9303]|uniref:Uncharacterized protein n=1 Tax=Prochlorococcus marinus (strain MIT 9303) TaxID=59922 RepID=A2CBX0_PROM3|nr:Hypothetical protein P9303_22451 [Prochlorococcus marinus str. MIT 9303]
MLLHVLAFELMQENPFCSGGATDVAEANEQQPMIHSDSKRCGMSVNRFAYH